MNNKEDIFDYKKGFDDGIIYCNHQRDLKEKFEKEERLKEELPILDKFNEYLSALYFKIRDEARKEQREFRPKEIRGIPGADYLVLNGYCAALNNLMSRNFKEEYLRETNEKEV